MRWEMENHMRDFENMGARGKPEKPPLPMTGENGPQNKRDKDGGSGNIPPRPHPGGTAMTTPCPCQSASGALLHRVDSSLHKLRAPLQSA